MCTHFAQITAYDPTNTSMTSNATVQVLVRDDNDNTPEFVQESYHFVTEEETLPSNVVTLGTVRAEDIDRVDIGKSLSNVSRVKLCLYGVWSVLYFDYVVLFLY